MMEVHVAVPLGEHGCWGTVRTYYNSHGLLIGDPWRWYSLKYSRFLRACVPYGSLSVLFVTSLTTLIGTELRLLYNSISACQYLLFPSLQPLYLNGTNKVTFLLRTVTAQTGTRREPAGANTITVRTDWRSETPSKSSLANKNKERKPLSPVVISVC